MHRLDFFLTAHTCLLFKLIRRHNAPQASAVWRTTSSMSFFFQLHSDLQVAIVDMLDFADR